MKTNEPSSLLPGLPPGAEILIVRLRSMGDIVLETPAIAALHAWRPDLQIRVLVEPRFAAALEGNPAVSGLILSREFAKTAQELHRRQFPAVFNQHGGPRSALLTSASKSPARVCWKGFQFSFLYNVHVPDVVEFYGKPMVHTVEHRISQFYFTGLPRGPIPNAQIFPQADAIASVAGKLADKGLKPGAAYAVLQPGARSSTMRWPVAKYAEIARWLRDVHGIASVVNIGARGAEEEGLGAEINRDMKDCAVLPSPLDLRELIALVAGARLFVGNDSGPAHLAAAAGRPAVVIFGSTNPVQWHPWKSEYRIVGTGARFQTVRGDKSVLLGESRPIQAIPLEEVRNACEELFATESFKTASLARSGRSPS